MHIILNRFSLTNKELWLVVAIIGQGRDSLNMKKKNEINRKSEETKFDFET